MRRNKTRDPGSTSSFLSLISRVRDSLNAYLVSRAVCLNFRVETRRRNLSLFFRPFLSTMKRNAAAMKKIENVCSLSRPSPSFLSSLLPPESAFFSLFTRKRTKKNFSTVHQLCSLQKRRRPVLVPLRLRRGGRTRQSDFEQRCPRRREPCRPLFREPQL